MGTLPHAIETTIARRGAATALLFEGTEHTYSDLGAYAAAFAGGLARRGVHPGDRVALGLRNSPDLVVSILGILQAGAILVPLNPASSADELLYILADSGARAAVLEDEHATIAMGASLPDLSLLAGCVAEIAAEPGGEIRVAPEAPALIVYTSGTTGRPKGAVLSHGALLSNLLTVARAWQWTERDRLLLTLPCFHLHGLGLGLIASLLVGSAIILQRRFVVEQVPADLERFAATMFFGVPTMYNRLVALPEEALAGRDLHRMRLWVSGSAPLPAVTFERFRRRFGHELVERYGMTECGFVLSTPYEGPRRGGTVGVPLPGISVRIVDADAADRGELVDVDDGVQGEIAIRGPNLFSGYWQRPQETQRVFIDGHLRSGDLAVRDPDGMVRIVGRSSVDIIKTRGFKVSAVEIEACLQCHPGVQEVAVVGLPDADQGERIVAAVTPVADAALTDEALRIYARQHLAPHKVPAAFVFVEDIPRSGPGKVKKKDLIRQLSGRATG